ncbi:MAG: hypothetical protein ACYCOO_08120 [Chitinophagaceae bacterium]
MGWPDIFYCLLKAIVINRFNGKVKNQLLIFYRELILNACFGGDSTR